MVQKARQSRRAAKKKKNTDGRGNSPDGNSLVNYADAASVAPANVPAVDVIGGQVANIPVANAVFAQQVAAPPAAPPVAANATAPAPARRAKAGL